MSNADGYSFDNIDALIRNRDIEGETGTELGLGNGMALQVLAASDANPRWRARGDDILAEHNRLRNAKASPQKVRDWWSRIYAECLVIGWSGIKSNGVEVPFSVEACTAFLRKADDAFTAIENIVFETKNFRGQRFKAIEAEAKN